MNQSRICVFLSLTLLLLFVVPAEVTAQAKWNGFDREDFTVDSRPCYIVKPNEPAAGGGITKPPRFLADGSQRGVTDFHHPPSNGFAETSEHPARFAPQRITQMLLSKAPYKV